MFFNLKFGFIRMLILFAFYIFLSNCGHFQTSNPILKPSLEKKSTENLYSKEETIELTKNSIGKQKAFDYKKDLKLIYSRAMYCDSMFYIGYQPPHFKENKGTFYKTDINTLEWIMIKNEIIEIYEQLGLVYLDRACEEGDEDYDISKLDFQSSKKIPRLTFFSASYNFLEEVSKLDDRITYIESGCEEIDMEAFNRFIEENNKK